ncbi:MAG: hypothetical protein EZS28_001815 [Streblomastix strix]|uniref:SPRY domain-containing protein n=1 Tax=Streblomastix strix TaxID=222440 RepID=A0A5J4X604_9EUKA|nr:MAG: hypothetical protein EZS28_001815 [Streblomastix strix]
MADLSEYNVINGLPGLGPDILLEILSELRLIPDAIHIIGINKKTLQLQNHDRFYKIIESLSFPIQLINPDLQEIDFIDVDDVRKKISKKISNKISKKINYKNITVSLSQVLENGIGIVRDTYNIPDDTNPYYSPHCNNMVSYGMNYYGNGNGEVHYLRKGTSGNIAFNDNQIIKAEFDSEKGTLIFFVDEEHQPVYVSGINEKVRFFITIGFPYQCCTIRSLKKLIKPATKHIPNENAIHW